MPSQNEIRERITNTIVESLKSGGLPPWRQPVGSRSQRRLSGERRQQEAIPRNQPLALAIAAMRHGLKGKWWATFNQWKELGGSVMKRPDNVPPGEWGTGIIFFKPLKITEENEDGDEEKTIFMMRAYTVFNIDQVEGEHLDHLRVGKTIINANPVDTYEEADRVIAATGADIRYGGNHAFYNRAQDFIQVPLREPVHRRRVLRDDSARALPLERAPSRLDWNRKEEGYAMGELIAEMGSCFLASGTRHPQRRPTSKSCQLLAKLAQGHGERHKVHFPSVVPSQQSRRLHLELLPCRGAGRSRSLISRRGGAVARRCRSIFF